MASGRVCRPAASTAAGDPTHPGRGAGPGGGAQTRAARPHRRPGGTDPAGPFGLVTVGTHALLRHFDRLELRTRPDGQPPQTFGRFEAEAPNVRWVGDALHGPKIAGRKTYLFCFLDDHSRAVMGARWGYFEDTVRLAAAFRRALAARGIPRSIHVDNGSAFVDDALKRAAARLGIRIIHATPYRPLLTG